MNKLINISKLEKLLIARWADFLDQKTVMAYTLNCVRDNKEKFELIEESDLPNKNVQILLSQFQLVEFGFNLWIDFTVPSENEITVGTIEAFLSNTGSLRLKNIVGNRFVKQLPAI